MKSMISVFLFLMAAGQAVAEVGSGGAFEQGAAEQFSRVSDKRAVFLDIARDEKGQVMLMTWKEAVQYCRSLKTHLPNAPELALLSMSFGAKGFVDSCEPNMSMCKKVMLAIGDGGSVHWFSFSSEGYKRPAGELGDNWFWASSEAYFPYPVYAHYLDGRDGKVSSTDPGAKGAVRCVDDGWY